VECYEGEWRRPVNMLQEQVVGGGHKSIHDDATAAAAGFRSGAPIHGTVHWSQLTPLLLKVFGAEWFEHGTISVSFKTIVSHLQPVKAFIEKPKTIMAANPPSPNNSGRQVMIWMEHADGRVVFDGTASLQNKNNGDGTTKITMVEKQLQRIKPVQGKLVFVPYPVGTKTLNVEEAQINWNKIIGTHLFPFTLEKKLEIITEWHPWFSKAHGKTSPWRRAILPPESLNEIMLYTIKEAKWPTITDDSSTRSGTTKHTKKRSPVGLFGGCEVKIHNGPCFVGENYYITRELIALGETPKTEFRWTKATMKDKSGKLIAEMTLQDMMLKNTVENYESLRDVANQSSNVPTLSSKL